MTIKETATAGTLESSDALVTIGPGKGLEIIIDSVVKEIFGDQIEACIKNTLAKLNVADAKVYIQDKGALDCTISARVETAALRAMRGATQNAD